MQNVDIACDQMVLRDDGYRVSKLCKNLEAATGNLQFSFYRLIWVGHTAQHQGLRLPTIRLQFSAQQLGCIGFDYYFTFEIKTCGKPKIFMRRPRVTID